MAYNPNFRGGVKVAVGNVDGNGLADIITVPQSSGGPHVRIFSRSGRLISQFFARDKNERSGLNVAIGDVNGDGLQQIIITPWQGVRPEVNIFDWLGNQQNQLMAYNPNFLGGVVVDVLK